MTVAGQTAVTYTYDNANRLTAIDVGPVPRQLLTSGGQKGAPTSQLRFAGQTTPPIPEVQVES